MSSEAVKTWRAKTKARMIEAMGGKCVECGYSRCNDALEFHHVDAAEKEFTISNTRVNCVSWKKIVAELRKCVLFCARCHREWHAGILETDISKVAHFDEHYADYKKMENDLREETRAICPVCNENKVCFDNITCSLACAAKRSRKVDWDSIDLPKLQETMSNVAIAKMLGVSLGQSGVQESEKDFERWWLPRLALPQQTLTGTRLTGEHVYSFRHEGS